MLQLYRAPPYPPIQELARPELKLAGVIPLVPYDACSTHLSPGCVFEYAEACTSRNCGVGNQHLLFSLCTCHYRILSVVRPCQNPSASLLHRSTAFRRLTAWRSLEVKKSFGRAWEPGCFLFPRSSLSCRSSRQRLSVLVQEILSWGVYRFKACRVD